MSASRLAAHIVEEVEDHFKSFKKCKEYWGIQDEDIYNFDKAFKLALHLVKRL
jgi:hypothetical protein